MPKKSQQSESKTPSLTSIRFKKELFIVLAIGCVPLVIFIAFVIAFGDCFGGRCGRNAIYYRAFASPVPYALVLGALYALVFKNTKKLEAENYGRITVLSLVVFITMIFAVFGLLFGALGPLEINW